MKINTKYSIYFRILFTAVFLTLTLCISVKAETLTEGICGTNLTYVLDSEGTLTISGTGSMSNYYNVVSESGNDSPWYDYKSNITKVVIEDGVTSIGNGAFISCYELTDISIPASVTSIGTTVFCGCDILINISVDEGNENYCSIDNVLFKTDVDGNTTCLVWYPSSKPDTEYTIPATVSSIDAYAFEGCTNLTDITMQDGVERLGEGVFYECTNLKNIALSENLSTIGIMSFYYCKGLTYIKIPASVTFINDFAFSYCTNLSHIDILSTSLSVGTYPFFSVSSKNIYTKCNFSLSSSFNKRYLVDDDESLYIDNIDTEACTFDIVVDTDTFGGEEGAYLEGIQILVNDSLISDVYYDGDNVDEDSSEYIKYYSYDGDKAVFKVKYSNSTGETAYVRAKIIYEDSSETVERYSVLGIIEEETK